MLLYLKSFFDLYYLYESRGTYKNTRYSILKPSFVNQQGKYSGDKGITGNNNIPFDKQMIHENYIRSAYNKNWTIEPSIAEKSSYKLIWSDEFDGTSLDLNKWEHEINCYGGGNNEQQCYVSHPDVLSVKEGLLTIKAKNVDGGVSLGPYDICNASEDTISKGACTNKLPAKSARIRTKFNNGHKWKYGRFEMRAKIPKGNYLWPAFWMLPVDNVYGAWAASGEFDIFESRGQNPDESLQTLHYGGSWPNNIYTTSSYKEANMSDKFQIFGMIWEETFIRFYINNNTVYETETSKNWASPNLPKSPYLKPNQPWDQDFYILLNLAVGGNFFPEGKFDPSKDPESWKQDFIIDYVRVYKKE